MIGGGRERMEILIFIIGLCVGSFINVCIYRVPKGESVVYPSSHCTKCNYRLRWYDLIPILSYIALGGRCRNCGEKISVRYPVVELLIAFIFLMIFYLHIYI